MSVSYPNAFKALRAKLGFSQERLGKDAGVVKQTINAIELGATKVPGHDLMRQLETKYGPVDSWTQEDDLESQLIDSELPSNAADIIDVPLIVGAALRAGFSGAIQGDAPFVVKRGFSRNSLRRQGCQPEECVMTQVQGDSMDGGKRPIADKEFVVFDRSQTHVSNSGGVYAIDFEELPALKRIQPRPGKVYAIISDNEDKTLYPTVEVSQDDPRLLIIGRVVHRSGWL